MNISKQQAQMPANHPTQGRRDEHILKDRYQLLAKLSEGTYGKVYKAYDLHKKQYVAIKKMKKISDGLGMSSTHMREVSALKNLQHENIIQLHDQFISPSGSEVENMEFFMIFEFVETDLYQVIKSYRTVYNSFIPTIQIQSFMYQLSQGIYAMHSNQYVHRDIKPQNILVTKEGKVKIADMGLTRIVGSKRQPLTPGWITIWYRPLEMLRGQDKYTKEVDIWSLGCIFGEMCLLVALFQGENESDQTKKIIEKLSLPEDFPDREDYVKYIPKAPINFQECFPYLPAQGIDLLQKMLEIDPKKRFTAKQCLSHPFFDEVRNLSLEEINALQMQQLPQFKGYMAEQIQKFQQMKREKMIQEQQRQQAEKLAQQQEKEEKQVDQVVEETRQRKSDSMEASPEFDI